MKRIPEESVREHQRSRKHEQVTDGHQNREGDELTAYDRDIPGYENSEDVPWTERDPRERQWTTQGQ